MDWLRCTKTGRILEIYTRPGVLVTSVTDILSVKRGPFPTEPRTHDKFVRVATFGVTMEFEWDEAKNRVNIRKHGFDFADAEILFRGMVLAYPDLRHDYGENRWVALGLIRGCIAQIVYVEHPFDTIRVISLRKATKSERQEFEKAIKNRLEAD